MSDSNTLTRTAPIAEVELDEPGLGALFDALIGRGLTVVGPTVRAGAADGEPLTRVLAKLGVERRLQAAVLSAHAEPVHPRPRSAALGRTAQKVEPNGPSAGLGPGCTVKIRAHAHPIGEETAMMYRNDHGMNGWGYGLMTVGMLLVWGPIILGVVTFVRHVGRAWQHPLGTPPANRPTPEQLLAERFTRGEIDADTPRVAIFRT